MPKVPKTGKHFVVEPGAPVTVTLWHHYVGENQQALDLEGWFESWLAVVEDRLGGLKTPYTVQ